MNQKESFPRQSKPELLAPAGNLESIEAVLHAGADAVYFGTKAFNMRQHRRTLNLEHSEVEKGIHLCHEKKSKAYLTFNSLLGCHEMKAAQTELEFLLSLQPDAIIIQDLGSLKILRDLHTKVPIHASTMMNVHNSEMAKILGELGVARMITSRDITLEEVRKMGETTGIEMEYFIHGDMCVAESGQCYQSSITFGESSNRGRCMKPCRWRYDLIHISQEGQKEEILESQSMLLARKDMCLLQHIPALLQSKIVSFKIEGRARSHDYLAQLVGIYRRALDRALGIRDMAQMPDASTDEKALYEMRIRDFSTCFAFGRPGKEGVDTTGSREPRIFSIAKAEPSLSPKNNAMQVPPDSEKKIPRLLVYAPNAFSASRALQSGADIVCLPPEEIRKWQDEGNPSKNLSQIRMKTPRILTDCEMAEWLTHLQRQNLDPNLAVEISNLGLLAPLKKMGFQRFYAGFSLNILNHEATEILRLLGFQGITSSFESGWENLARLAKLSKIAVGAPVHGFIPGMLVEDCIVKEKAPCPTESDSWIMRDSAGGNHALYCEYGGRLAISAATDLCMLPWLSEFVSLGLAEVSLGLEHSTPERVETITKIYRTHLDALAAGHKCEKETVEKDLAQLTLCASRPLGVGAYNSGCFHVSKEGQELERILVGAATHS